MRYNRNFKIIFIILALPLLLLNPQIRDLVKADVEDGASQVCELILNEKEPNDKKKEENKRIYEACKKYIDDELTYDEAISAYHKDVNKIFRNKINKLTKMKSEDLIATFSVEKPECEMEDPSDKKNTKDLSANCVGQLARIKYIGFVEAMNYRRERVKEVKQCLTERAEGSKAYKQTFEQSAAETDIRSFVISKELEVAKKTLDKSLAGYNELFWAWPLHQQYQIMIKELTKYRDQLANVRNHAEFFPGKFIDASTTDCQ